MVVLSLSGLTLGAQDLIVCRDGQSIKAKITEVNPDNVRYKRFDNLEGPTYTLLLSDIQSIAYENGTTDSFDATPDSEIFAIHPEQLRDRLHYRKLKRNYVRSNYIYLTDPHYSTSRGWLNLILPGLAQFTMGEAGLGIRYVFFEAAWTTFSSVYLFLGESTPFYMDEGTLCFAIGSAGILLNTVLSIVNANKVAKVKSLYYHDLNVLHRTNQLSFEFAPVVLPVYSLDGLALAPGLGMQLKF